MKKSQNNGNLPAKEPGKLKKWFRNLFVALGFSATAAAAVTSAVNKSDKEVEADEPRIESDYATKDNKETKENEPVTKEPVTKETKTEQETSAKVETPTAEEIADEALNYIEQAANKAPEIVTGPNGVTQSEYADESVVEPVTKTTVYNYTPEIEVETPKSNNEKETEKATETLKVESVKSLEKQVKEKNPGSKQKVGIEVTGDVKYKGDSIELNGKEERATIKVTVEDNKDKIEVIKDEVKNPFAEGVVTPDEAAVARSSNPETEKTISPEKNETEKTGEELDEQETR